MQEKKYKMTQVKITALHKNTEHSVLPFTAVMEYPQHTDVS